ncbi:MAG: PDZ domain-containing protein [Dehalococcoidia bacterium]|nr:PDZ domain-containing protein [Dehalococcoidia bacterium]
MNTAKNVLAQLLNNTTVKRPWLGISGVALSADLADQLGVSSPRGIYIVTVGGSSPAEQAGLKGGTTGTDGSPGAGGDIITATDGRSVGTVEDLVTYFNSLRPWDAVSLTLIRDGKSVQVRVVLGEWPDTLGSSPR